MPKHFSALRSPASRSRHKQKGKDYTGYKAANMIPDANTGNGKAKY
jgi:hypothetical protein